MKLGALVFWLAVCIVLWILVIALATSPIRAADRTDPIRTIPAITPAPSIRIPIGTIPPRITLPPTDTR